MAKNLYAFHLPVATISNIECCVHFVGNDSITRCEIFVFKWNFRGEQVDNGEQE